MIIISSWRTLKYLKLFSLFYAFFYLKIQECVSFTANFKHKFPIIFHTKPRYLFDKCTLPSLFVDPYDQLSKMHCTWRAVEYWYRLSYVPPVTRQVRERLLPSSYGPNEPFKTRPHMSSISGCSAGTATKISKIFSLFNVHSNIFEITPSLP